jgi:probable HAF family extracellular repeat protein
MTDLGTLSGFASVHPIGINAGNVVVGEASNDPAPGSAFIWQNGVIRDLNTLIPTGSGWFLQQATAINDGGQIVGNGTVGGQVHAFLLTPIQ